MSMTAVPISIRLVRAPTAASSAKGDPSCLAKWCTRKYAPSAPSSSAATARSIDCSNASDADRVCEPGDADQCPNDRKPIFFTSVSTRAARAAFLSGGVARRARFVGGMRHDVRVADEVRSAVRGSRTPQAEVPVAAQPFTHLGVPHAEHYRRLLRVFARAKERFIVHLRPDDVAAELRVA